MIYVISDASSDRTDQIVLREAIKDDRIKLVRKPERKGKWDSLNLAISLSQADILVFLDADIRFANEKVIPILLVPFLRKDVALVAGNPRPTKCGIGLNAGRQAAYFGWVLVEGVTKGKAAGFYNANGRILALSRKLYQHLVLPDSPADDQYIYLSCIKEGFKFAYAEESVVYYGLPRTVGDYLKQSVRFRLNTAKSGEMFGRDFIERETKVPHRLAIFLPALLKHPYAGLMWVICYLTGQIRFLIKHSREKEASGMWDVANTTK